MEAIGYIRIPLSGKYGKGKFTLVDGDYDGEYFSQYKWYLNPKTGYVYRSGHRDDTGKRGIIVLHQEVSRTPKGLVTDHKNRDKLDNRSCNLRWATYKQNSQNQDFASKSMPVRRRKKSGLPRGVLPCYKWGGEKYEDRWQVVVKGRHVGIYTSLEEAVDAYNKRARELWSDRAVMSTL